MKADNEWSELWIGAVFTVLGLILLAIWLSHDSVFYVEQDGDRFVIKRNVQYWHDQIVSEAETRHVAEYVAKYLNEQGTECY